MKQFLPKVRINKNDAGCFYCISGRAIFANFISSLPIHFLQEERYDRGNRNECRR